MLLMYASVTLNKYTCIFNLRKSYTALMAFYYDGTGTDPWHLRAQTSVTWVISGIYEHEQRQKYFSLLTCKIPHKVEIPLSCWVCIQQMFLQKIVEEPWGSEVQLSWKSRPFSWAFQRPQDPTGSPPASVTQ